MTEGCKNCFYSREVEVFAQTATECRHELPRIDDQDKAGYWPQVGDDGWCGEWKKKAETVSYHSMMEWPMGPTGIETPPKICRHGTPLARPCEDCEGSVYNNPRDRLPPAAPKGPIFPDSELESRDAITVQELHSFLDRMLGSHNGTYTGRKREVWIMTSRCECTPCHHVGLMNGGDDVVLSIGDDALALNDDKEVSDETV